MDLIIRRSPSESQSLMRWTTLLLLACLTIGCPGNRSTAPAAGKISIKGSNTIGEELAPHLIAEYTNTHPAVSIELESKGTGSGFTALFGGQCDIAAASRVANNEELNQAHTNKIDLNVHTIGHYAFAVVVNGRCGVTNLVREQVRDIFTGAIQNWKELGGPDAPIHRYIRDSHSGTYLGFRELAMEDKEYTTDATTKMTNYVQIADAVAGDANGIGYTSIELATHQGVKAVLIRGVTADATSVNEGRYPYARILRLYTNRTNESPATLDFIEFVQSQQGQKVLSDMGFVPRL
jgi:phosphate transport system substrate-binding protein